MIKSLRRQVTFVWMDEREYQANIHGLQIVFGAVLGFVLAGAERFDSYSFAVLLIMTIGVVVSILYISASKQRLAYTALALGGGLAVPAVILEITKLQAPEKLAPTLFIWGVIMAAIEFAPRKPNDATEPKAPQ